MMFIYLFVYIRRLTMYYCLLGDRISIVRVDIIQEFQRAQNANLKYQQTNIVKVYFSRSVQEQLFQDFPSISLKKFLFLWLVKYYQNQYRKLISSQDCSLQVLLLLKFKRIKLTAFLNNFYSFRENSKGIKGQERRQLPKQQRLESAQCIFFTFYAYQFWFSTYNNLKKMERNTDAVHRKYDKIDIETRRLLVHEVMVEERSISKTAKKLGVKLSTAKVIIKRFKEEGTFFQTKKDKQQRLQKEERQHNEVLNSEQGRKHQITTNINIEFPFSGFGGWNGSLPNFHPFVFYEAPTFPLQRNIWFSELN